MIDSCLGWGVVEFDLFILDGTWAFGISGDFS
jgi:hypothetical protein